MASELQVNTITEATSGSGITFAKDIIPATPLSHRNVIINGAMQVAQRATSKTDIGAGDGYYTVDRYYLDNAGLTGRLTSSQDSDSPNGFGHSLKFDCTTADTSIDAGDHCILSTRLEGQDLQRFAKGTSDAKGFMVSFYVKGNASATYVCELFDEDNTRQISKSFNVTTSWTRVELAFPADTTGAFANDNGRSLYFQIWLHAGTTYTSGTLNSTAWASPTSANRAAGITSFFDSTNRTFFLTGVQLELGSVATPFEHRSYADELRRCQRYYYKPENTVNGYLGKGHMYASGTVRLLIPHPVTMRTSATTLEQDYGNQHFYAMENSSAVGYMHTNWTTALNGENATCIGGGTADGHYTAGNGVDIKLSESTAYIALSAEI